jgi:hypothetical protein
MKVNVEESRFHIIQWDRLRHVIVHKLPDFGFGHEQCPQG